MKQEFHAFFKKATIQGEKVEMLLSSGRQRKAAGHAFAKAVAA